MDPRYNSSIVKLAGREEIVLVWVSFIFTVAPLQLDRLKSHSFLLGWWCFLSGTLKILKVFWIDTSASFWEVPTSCPLPFIDLVLV